MTRDEAIKMLKIKLPYDHESIDPKLLVMSLEILGLIKFDEEKSGHFYVITNCLNKLNVDDPIGKADKIIEALGTSGYVIKDFLNRMRIDETVKIKVAED